MNIDEELTYLHLQSRGYTDIVHEPDGNIPPDFLVNGKIAIEVRRLNKYFIDTTGKKNIEDLDFWLHKTMLRIIDSFSNVESSSSCYVFYNFKRPLPTDKDILRRIKAIFDEQLLVINQYIEYEIDENLNIRFLPVGRKLKEVFRFGGMVDKDAGGFVVSEICKNIGDIIQEKELKVKPFRHKYNQWWLALVDRIAWGIDETDKIEIKKTIHPGNVFDKILIITPVNPEKGIFLYER